MQTPGTPHRSPGLKKTQDCRGRAEVPGLSVLLQAALILPMNVHSSGGEGTAQGGRSHGSPPNSGNPVLNAAEYRNGGQAPRRAVGPGQQRISASERHCHALGRKRMDGSERGTLLKNVSRGLMDSGYRPGVRCSGGAFQKHIFRKTVKKTAWVEAKVSGKANSPAAADEQGLRFSD